MSYLAFINGKVQPARLKMVLVINAGQTSKGSIISSLTVSADLLAEMETKLIID